MAKMTKTQTKRMLMSIRGKASTLWQHEPELISTKDLITIENIVKKYLKKLG